MQAQALSSRMNMNRPIPVQRLVTDISDSKAFSFEFILRSDNFPFRGSS